jgi:hypothetical protein
MILEKFYKGDYIRILRKYQDKEHLYQPERAIGGSLSVMGFVESLCF